MFLNQYSVDETTRTLLEDLNFGDQWIDVPPDSLLIQITQTNNSYIIETYIEGIHYIDNSSFYLVLPQAYVILRSDGYAVLILSPFGGNYITLSRETWELNLPTLAF